MELFRAHVLVCCGTGCTSSSSPQIMDRFSELLPTYGLDKEIKIVKTGCF